jgi:hypothetical protein
VYEKNEYINNKVYDILGWSTQNIFINMQVSCTLSCNWNTCKNLDQMVKV